jgi:hypothetical protein
METLFPLGQILATPGAIQAAQEAGGNLATSTAAPPDRPHRFGSSAFD